MGARKTPGCLVSGELYKIGKPLDAEKSKWETLERRAHTDKQRLASETLGLLAAEKTAEAIDLLDERTQTAAHAQLAILKQLVPR
jgi:hypothetical protein